MERIDGTIETVTYQNDDTGYCVLQVLTASGGLCTCVGSAPAVRRGMSVSFDGDWATHKRFGRQFAFKGYQIARPTTIDGITHLLESGLISNIGAKRARMIVGKFGLETLNVLDDAPDRLSEVSGIGGKTLAKIKDSWAQQRHMRGLVLFLQEHDISAATANRLYKAYGGDAERRICENPYTLIDDVWGIGFVKADAIAVKMGFDVNSYKRIKAGIVYTLQEAASANGHTYLPKAEIEAVSTELLGVTAEQVLYTLDDCISQEALICEDGCVYLPYLYHAEAEAARCLSERIGGGNRPALSDKEIDEFIGYYQQKTGWIGAPEQLEAVRRAAKNKIFILTGGPGTGKTTALRAIVALFTQLNLRIALAAPTGRAAARMGSISGIAARTIHRLLEFKPNSGAGGFKFLRCESNPIEADAVILDEASMIDITLMKSFVSAVPRGAALILVGDKNQLPSVGPGNVLADLIASERIPHVELTRIFRQSAMSRIVTAAHEIIGGETPEFSNSAADNCFLAAENDPQKCLGTLVDLVSRRLPARYGLDPMADIQVLSPMHRGTLGTVSINAALAGALNKNGKKICAGQYTFTLGDRVIQTKNNYDAGVFNGDIGFITAMADGKVTVTFDKTPATYDERDLDQIIPAYCISIHKSQGSEFRAVVIPVSTQHFIMLQRNLIYTALTRAKELCVFVGTKNALSMAVRNDKALTRNSRLCALIDNR
ncbi:MAG: ATP-dependent RecD-like DNA helicase [Chitinispirillales bacterium]|jgi:exodeoxyribonuclease V alpha subunit|nr:ATP-dependent RecD-like DNA helicase [Chitinispirillales bacterium]